MDCSAPWSLQKRQQRAEDLLGTMSADFQERRSSYFTDELLVITQVRVKGLFKAEGPAEHDGV